MHFPGKFTDYLVEEQLHRVSLSFLVDDLVVRRGGIGANIAFGMAQLGCHPLLVGAAGKDFAEYAEWLGSHGVDCSGVLVSDTLHTARFVSTSDDEMCQIATFYAGAMADAQRIELTPLATDGGLDLVLISPDDPEAMVAHAAECRERGYLFAVDPSQQLARMEPEQVRQFITGATYLFSNDYELELLLRKTGWSAQQVLAKVGTRITTLGEHGVEIVDAGGQVLHVAAVPETVKAEPTGIGDGFRAGFLAGLHYGLSCERAAQLGSMVAVLVLETVGTQEWTFDKAAALRRIEDAYGSAAAADIGAALPG
ncbi:MAG: carbohydrate kinase family protein [Sciscionella sp.]